MYVLLCGNLLSDVLIKSGCSIQGFVLSLCPRSRVLSRGVAYVACSCGGCCVGCVGWGSVRATGALGEFHFAVVWRDGFFFGEAVRPTRVSLRGLRCASACISLVGFPEVALSEDFPLTHHSGYLSPPPRKGQRGSVQKNCPWGRARHNLKW
jgi:hypothetical protein